MQWKAVRQRKVIPLTGSFSQVSLGGKCVFASLIKSESVISEWRIVGAYQIIMVNKQRIFLACIYISTSPVSLLHSPSLCDLVCVSALG